YEQAVEMVFEVFRIAKLSTFAFPPMKCHAPSTAKIMRISRTLEVWKDAVHDLQKNSSIFCGLGLRCILGEISLCFVRVLDQRDHEVNHVVTEMVLNSREEQLATFGVGQVHQVFLERRR